MLHLQGILKTIGTWLMFCNLHSTAALNYTKCDRKVYLIPNVLSLNTNVEHNV